MVSYSQCSVQNVHSYVSAYQSTNRLSPVGQEVSKIETSTIIISITVITIEKMIDERLQARSHILEKRTEVRYTMEDEVKYQHPEGER